MGICRTNEKGPRWVGGEETDSKSEKVESAGLVCRLTEEALDDSLILSLDSWVDRVSFIETRDFRARIRYRAR